MSAIAELFDRCVALHQAGEHTVAAHGYAAILRADPKHADAWHLSGVLAHQTGRSADAIGFIQQAISLAPTKAEYFSNLAAIQMSCGQWASGLAAAENAIAIDPDSPAAWFQKGRALGGLGQYAAAMTALRCSEERGFNRATVQQEIANLLESTGNLTESAEALEESLRNNPLQPSVWFALSRLVSTGLYSFSESQVRQMETFLTQAANHKERSRTLFAMATHLDRIADYDRAAACWKSGNEDSRASIQQRGVSYDPAQHAQLVNDLIQVFSRSFVDSLGPVSSSTRPIVVIGMPRSGTSLVEQILASHPDVAAGGELTFWPQTFHQRFGTDLFSALSKLTDDWRFKAALDYERVLTEISPNATRVVDKLPGNYLFAGLIATMFPQATIIHCRRDPRDTCLSCYSQLFDDEQLQLATSDLVSLAQRYREYARLMTHWYSVLPDRILDMSYERLVMNPEDQVRRLLAACRLPWNEQCLSFHQSRSAVKTASVVQVRQPLHSKSRGRWTQYAGLLEPVCSELAAVIAAYNAEIEGPGCNAEM